MPETHPDINTTAWVLLVGVVFVQNPTIMRLIAQRYFEWNLFAQKNEQGENQTQDYGSESHLSTVSPNEESPQGEGRLLKCQ